MQLSIIYPFLVNQRMRIFQVYIHLLDEAIAQIIVNLLGALFFLHLNIIAIKIVTMITLEIFGN